MTTRPRVLLLSHATEWSYGFNARGVAGELGDRFEFRIVPRGTRGGELRAWRPALAVDYWWKGRSLRVVPGVPAIKQVSSHRWRQDRHGALDAAGLIEKHLAGAAAVIVPSVRLQRELEAAGSPRVHLCPKGFEPDLFHLERSRRGPLAIGWAGNATALDKRVDLLRTAAPGLVIADRKIPHRRMGRFYNALDVVAIASDAEGDPLPLIEGMECGCFPVATDVGIVPELVQHGVNGLIVEQSVGAFRDAFAWCRANLDFVRAAGARNAETMLTSRTWAHVAPAWADAFTAAIPA